MDIVVAKDGQELGIISAKDFLSISNRDDILAKEIYYKLVVSGGMDAFNLLYSGDVYYDNEVPEAPVTIDVVSYDVNLGEVSVLGYQKYSDILSVTTNKL